MQQELKHKVEILLRTKQVLAIYSLLILVTVIVVMLIEINSGVKDLSLGSMTVWGFLMGFSAYSSLQHAEKYKTIIRLLENVKDSEVLEDDKFNPNLIDLKRNTINILSEISMGIMIVLQVIRFLLPKEIGESGWYLIVQAVTAIITGVLVFYSIWLSNKGIDKLEMEEKKKED